MSLKAIVSVATIVSAIIGLLSFSIGRASVVSDLRKEIADNYIGKEQYRIDQQQQANVLNDITRKIDYIYQREIERAQMQRSIRADALTVEPD